MAEVSERIARLIGRIDETSRVAECPVCGQDSWDYGTEIVAAPKMAPNPERVGFALFPLICTNCAYVRFHSVGHLERE